MATIPANNVMVLHSQDPSLVGTNDHYHRQSFLDQTSPHMAVWYQFKSGTTWVDGTYEDCHGIEARWNSTTQETEFHVNSTSGTGNSKTCRPDAISLVPSGQTPSWPGAGAYVSAGPNDVGKDLVFWTGGSSQTVCLKHTLVAGSLFTSSGSSGPTITAINRLTPWTTTVNDGVNPPVSYHLEGEIVTNDTLTSSDVTLAKDFASYANSNLTLYQPSAGKFFGISKPSDGLYHIAVGDKHNDYLHIDSSWRNTITSSSSTRTTNSDRILNVISTIPMNAKIYVRVRKNALPHQTAFGPWSEWQAVGSDRHRFEHKLVYSGSDTQHQGYTQYGGSSDLRLSFVLGIMQDANGDDQIGGRFIVHKWRQDDHLNGFNYTGPLQELGAQSSIYSAKFSNDPNVAPYDKYFQMLVSDTWQYQYRIDDWLYHNEPEGDGDESTQTCDHDYANCRRRRAHSFW